MKIEKTNINAIEQIDINALSVMLLGTSEELPEDEVKSRFESVTTIDNGDHILNIWKDEAGQTKISIQATSDNVTLITLAA